MILQARFSSNKMLPLSKMLTENCRANKKGLIIEIKPALPYPECTRKPPVSAKTFTLRLRLICAVIIRVFFYGRLYHNPPSRRLSESNSLRCTKSTTPTGELPFLRYTPFSISGGSSIFRHHNVLHKVLYNSILGSHNYSKMSSTTIFRGQRRPVSKEPP